MSMNSGSRAGISQLCCDLRISLVSQSLAQRIYCRSLRSYGCKADWSEMLWSDKVTVLHRHTHRVIKSLPRAQLRALYINGSGRIAQFETLPLHQESEISQRLDPGKTEPAHFKLSLLLFVQTIVTMFKLLLDC